MPAPRSAQASKRRRRRLAPAGRCPFAPPSRWVAAAERDPLGGWFRRTLTAPAQSAATRSEGHSGAPAAYPAVSTSPSPCPRPMTTWGSPCRRCGRDSCPRSRPCFPPPGRRPWNGSLSRANRMRPSGPFRDRQDARPAETADTPGVFLAGSWTDTGWPATMEGAVRSGLRAARRALGTRMHSDQRDGPGNGHQQAKEDARL